MTPYAATVIDPSDIRIWEKVCEVVKQLPDLDLGTDNKGEKVILSCHILARAIANTFCLKHKDGHFVRGFNHSWVVLPSGNVIDTYPVGMLGGPLLVDDGAATLIKQLYIEMSEDRVRGYYPEFETVWFKTAVQTVIQAIEEMSLEPSAT